MFFNQIEMLDTIQTGIDSTDSHVCRAVYKHSASLHVKRHFLFQLSTYRRRQHQNTNPQVCGKLLSTLLYYGNHTEMCTKAKVFLRDIWEKCPKETCSITIRVQHLARNAKGMQVRTNRGISIDQKNLTRGQNTRPRISTTIS